MSVITDWWLQDGLVPVWVSPHFMLRATPAVLQPAAFWTPPGDGMAAFSPRAATQTYASQPRQQPMRIFALLVLVVVCCLFFNEFRVSNKSVGL